MKGNKLELRIPKFSELDYRKKLLEDSETMSYNIGFGEIHGTGCIDFDEGSWNEWFSLWINNAPWRYYAYIIKTDEDIPIGEVALRYVNERNAYCVSIIIEAKHRGKGYSKEALRLLADTAFYELGAKKIFDDFPSSRLAAEKAFKEVGFKRISADIMELTKEDYLY